ncbi:MAG: bifunctional serine/threonine-protein kinase/formylglycine-generating enzyme family protein [Desulfobacterales bacterium]
MFKPLSDILFPLDVLRNNTAKYDNKDEFAKTSIKLANRNEFGRPTCAMSNQTKSIFQIGYVLNDKWVIIEFIGKGAMGEVYRAHQLNLKRDVAIKVISREMLASLEDDPGEIETAIHRFRREVQAMAGVRHHNVLQIFDYGSDTIHKDDRDVPVEYIAMEYIPGATLRFTMSEEGFYPEQDLIAVWLAAYYLPLLKGVEAIHAKDISHRDLKPENVLMDGTTPKIADFGLACSICMQPVTQSLDVKGTPAYMSPEHFFDFKNADRQSDIYSLGKILYEAVDGKISSKVLPFKGARLENPDTPFLKKLDNIIQDATADKKEDRLKSVGDLRNVIIEALNILKTESIPDRPESSKSLSLLYQPRFIWTGIVIAILSIGAMGLWHLLGNPGEENASLKNPETIRMKLPPSGSTGSLTMKTAIPKTPEPFILGKDGMTMHLIPGGKLMTESKDTKDAGQTVQIAPFYMDEKMVTNHHFADFLNEMKNALVVENGIVKHNKDIWLYLGEGAEAVQQIIYKHDRFHLRDAGYAADPVTRVTWYGASAYARHYGKRLLTESEWEYVVSNHMIPSKQPSKNKADNPQINSGKALTGSQMHAHMMDMDATVDADKSQSKTPAPKKLGKIFKEWVIRNDTGQESIYEDKSKENIFYPSLTVATSQYPDQPFKNFRYPWEAFADVGFRCVISIGNEY